MLVTVKLGPDEQEVEIVKGIGRINGNTDSPRVNTPVKENILPKSIKILPIPFMKYRKGNFPLITRKRKNKLDNGVVSWSVVAL